MDESIVLPEPDEGFAAGLNERIDEFNAQTTGIGDGRLLQAELRDEGVLSNRVDRLDVGRMRLHRCALDQ